MKNCCNPDCKQINPQELENFTKSTKNKDGLQFRCKDCSNTKCAEWRKKNPDYRANYYLKNKGVANEKAISWKENNPNYRSGINLRIYWKNLSYKECLKNYNDLVLKQQNKCKICKKHETVVEKRTGKIKNLCVDHCHKTGKIRGLLCYRCNAGIGYLQDNPEICISASNYLIESKYD